MRTAGAAAVGVMLALIAGCAPSAPAVPTLDAVVDERLAAVERAERERFDAFVTSSSARIAELGVPVPEFQGVVPRASWPDEVAACIDRADPRIRADRVDERLTVSYFGMVGEDFDRSRWAIESCSAQFGVTDGRGPRAPGPLERTWIAHDTAARLAPCLRSLGLPAPILDRGLVAPGELVVMEAVDDAHAHRASVLCPSSADLIAARSSGSGR